MNILHVHILASHSLWLTCDEEAVASTLLSALLIKAVYDNVAHHVCSPDTTVAQCSRQRHHQEAPMILIVFIFMLIHQCESMHRFDKPMLLHFFDPIDALLCFVQPLVLHAFNSTRPLWGIKGHSKSRTSSSESSPTLCRPNPMPDELRSETKTANEKR
jgi:hypothetical protein